MKKNIVLLDDDLMSLRSLANTLKEWGYNTTCFQDYNESFITYDFTNTYCCIVDYNLNIRDGIYVLSFLKRKYPDLKRILISGYLINEQILRQNGSMYDFFLAKPINIMQLNEKLLQINKEEL